MSEPALKSALDEQGFAGPFPLHDRSRSKRVLMMHPFIRRKPNPHANSGSVARLMADPNLVEAVTTLCGDDLMVWRSAFFAKKRGSPDIGWHHDKHFQTEDSDTVSFNEMNQHFSVLIALRSIDGRTGRLELIPGSHLEDPRYKRDARPYHLRRADEHFLNDIPPEVVESRQGLDIPSGHFIVFHSALLHRSLPHGGGPPRVGLALRFTHRGVAVPKALASATDIRQFG